MKIAETTSSKTPIRGETKNANELFRNARRIEQQNYNGMYGGYYGGGGGADGEDMKDAWYLADYSLKMVSCLQGEQSMNYERGEVESSTVIFRLCPRDTCGNSTMGCDAGFGDFAVGINTFAQAYTESVKDNYNNGMQFYSYEYGEFNLEEYTKECRLFEGDNGEGGDYKNYYYNSYAYLGVACTADGKDIRLASFSDPYCTQESDSSFSSTHNGMGLPYGNGGLIPDVCMNCMTMNDNYEYEVSEMCKSNYEDASSRCEQNMQSYNSYYGQDNRGCDYIGSKLPSLSSSSASNFFREQSEGAKMAEEYIALLAVASFVGAGLVFCFTKKAIKKAKKQPEEAKDGVFVDEEEDEDSDLSLFAKKVKATVHEMAAKVVAMTRNGSTTTKKGGIVDTTYSPMDDGTPDNVSDVRNANIKQESSYVAPTTTGSAEA